MVLTGKTDAFSKTDVADQENIDSIFKVLKGLRHAIEQVIKI
jgi:hypothetical protein